MSNAAPRIEDQRPSEQPIIHVREVGSPSPARLAKALVNFALRRSQPADEAA